MKRVGFALLGAVAASAIVWGAVFALGYALEALGIQLYANESDQQRNFNFVLLGWGLLAAVGGWIGWRLGSSPQ